MFLSFQVFLSCQGRKPHSKISIAPATSLTGKGRKALVIGQTWQRQPIGSELSFGGTCPYLRLAGPVVGPLQFRHRRDHSSVSDHIHNLLQLQWPRFPTKLVSRLWITFQFKLTLEAVIGWFLRFSSGTEIAFLFSHVGFRNFLCIVPTVSIYKHLDYEVKKYLAQRKLNQFACCCHNGEVS